MPIIKNKFTFQNQNIKIFTYTIASKMHELRNMHNIRVTKNHA